MIEINKVYRFKDEFAKELSIPSNQIDRRQKELLDWLTNFFVYKFYDGCPKRIMITEIIGEYRPLPRKPTKSSELTKEKIEDYKNFTIASLGVEFKPNSQSKVAREAIKSFGYEKYSHTSEKAVANHYIKEPFQQFGESDNQKVWVWYSSYEKLPQEVAAEWRNILNEENIGEQEAANAFYKQEQGQDITKEKQYYKTAQQRFKDKYNDIAVLVTSWKLKENI